MSKESTFDISELIKEATKGKDTSTSVKVSSGSAAKVKSGSGI